MWKPKRTRDTTVGASDSVSELIGGRDGRRAGRGDHGHVHDAGARGAVAVIVVSLTTVKLVAAVVPKSTAVAPVKPVPVIVTKVPPAAGPLVGLRPVTVGAATAVKVN